MSETSFGLSIVTLSYNSKAKVIPNINYLCRKGSIGCYNVEIIAVDNNSDDGTKRKLIKMEKEYEILKVIMNDKNYGYKTGKNMGLRAAQKKYVLSIDDDAYISWFDIWRLLSAFDEFPKAGIVTPKVKHARRNEIQFGSDESAKMVGGFHGSCKIYKNEVLKEVGLLDNSYGTFGYDEPEYCIRAYNSGFEVIYVPWVTSYHDNKPHSGQEGIRRRYGYLFNQCRVNFKYLGVLQAIINSYRIFLSHLINGLKSNGLKVVPSLVNALLRGVYHGVNRKKTVKKKVREFYQKNDIYVDSGNVALYKKVLRKFG